MGVGLGSGSGSGFGSGPLVVRLERERAEDLGLIADREAGNLVEPGVRVRVRVRVRV